MPHIGYLEALLIQLLIYASVYIWDGYIGFLLCLIAGFIAAAILMFSIVFEFIERSKIPRSYFGYLVTTVIAPLAILLLFVFIEGEISWMSLAS